MKNDISAGKLEPYEDFIEYMSPWLLTEQEQCVMFLKNFYLLNWERERHRFVFFTYLCIHWLILVYGHVPTLTGDWTYNLGILEGHSNQLGYLARAKNTVFSFTDPGDENSVSPFCLTIGGTSINEDWMVWGPTQAGYFP